MNLIFSPSQLDRAIHRGVWGLIIGFPLLVAVIAIGHGPTVTPVVASMLGASCGSFMHWRQDRGLWMLAVLFLLISLPAYIGFALIEYFSSHAGFTLLEIVDFSVATLVLGKLCRLLVSVAVWNWRMHHSGTAENL